MSETEVNLSAHLSQRLQLAMNDIPEAKQYVVALSGGLDSIVLLYCMHALVAQRGNTLRAVHVHHGLSPQADAWQKHCQQVCKQLGVTLLVEKVNVQRAGEGIEAAARQARYGVFERVLDSGAVLLQGHHQNDLAETVLMRMLRGAGPEGMAAIPRQRRLGQGMLFRPFLQLPRRELETLAKARHWQWVEDESNHDLAFDRNYIRHKVMPVLEGRWSTTLESLTQVAQRAAQAQHLIEVWCQGELKRLVGASYRAYRALDLQALADYDEVQQRALVRYWFESEGIVHPGANIFERIWSEMIPAAPDASPFIQWGVHQLRRYDQHLFYTTEPSTRPLECDQSVAAPLENLPLSIELGSGLVLDMHYLPAGQPIAEGVLLLRAPERVQRMRVCSREGGEKLEMHEAGSPQSLKKAFQSMGMPPWEREQQLMLYFDDELVAAGSQLVAARWRPQVGQAVLVVDVHAQ